MLTTMYINASYVLKVKITEEPINSADGYTVESAEVIQSYSHTYLRSGKKAFMVVISISLFVSQIHARVE